MEGVDERRRYRLPFHPKLSRRVPLLEAIIPALHQKQFLALVDSNYRRLVTRAGVAGPVSGEIKQN
jgi:hypothetical protein